jgi:hypothetical protein
MKVNELELQAAFNAAYPTDNGIREPVDAWNDSFLEPSRRAFIKGYEAAVARQSEPVAWAVLFNEEVTKVHGSLDEAQADLRHRDLNLPKGAKYRRIVPLVIGSLLK